MVKLDTYEIALRNTKYRHGLTSRSQGNQVVLEAQGHLLIKWGDTIVAAYAPGEWIHVARVEETPKT